MKKDKIVAVVVTYNRKHLLKRCINAILRQEYKVDKIIVIDNASTDGTEEMMTKTYYRNKKIDYVRLDKNIGGAGGFHYGMKKAYKEGYDWIWVMDDDGYADKKCLKNILKNMPENKYDFTYLPLVINEKHELTWPMELILNNKIYRIYNINEIKNITRNHQLLYHNGAGLLGSLYSKQIIKKIGLPKKELFIRGDEVEYNLRAISNKINTIFIKDAKFFHPKQEFKVIKFFKKEIYFIHANVNLFKLFFIIRNFTYININYRKFPLNVILFTGFLLKWLFSLVYFSNFRNNLMKSLKIFIIALYKGLRKDFNNEDILKFLK
ncbi:MAG: glycosyltransferase family 2 protein [Candidatus Goldbacteria bacterium]|nr:glycosyltransferase family 2 protein [Candidatus Goldiibacteriota bacterium]